MWPAAQAADTGVGDAVRPGGRQGRRPRATWEDTRVERSKRPKGERSSFLSSGVQGRHGGMQEGIEVAEAKRSRRGSGPQPLPPSCLLGGAETTTSGRRPGGRGVKGEGQGRGSESRFWRAPTYCAASRVSMVVLAAACSHHPYLYLGPAPRVGGGRGAGWL